MKYGFGNNIWVHYEDGMEDLVKEYMDILKILYLYVNILYLLISKISNYGNVESMERLSQM